MPGIEKAVSPKSGCYTVAGSLTDDTRREIFNKMAENGCPILFNGKQKKLSLEEVFLKITDRQKEGGNE